MQIDVSTPVTNPDGSVALEGGEPVTFRTVVANALFRDTDRDASADAKYKRYCLGMKLQNSDGVVKLSVDDAALIKKHIGVVCSTFVMGRVYDILEPPDASPA